jgi:hypothetical protein
MTQPSVFCVSMKKIAVLLYIIIFCFDAYSQEDFISYYLKINEATNFSKQKRFIKADSIYDIAFSTVRIGHPEDYIKGAINACKMDSLNLSKNYLIKTISLGFPIKEVKSIKSLTPLVKSKYWREYKRVYRAKRKEYERNVNKELADRINTMYKNDQKYRGRMLFVNMEKQKVLDSLNLIEIKKMQTEYGKIPGIKEIGYEGMMLLYITFRHVEEDYSINVLGPQIIEQSKNGDFPPYMGPGIIDYKALMQVSSRQYYMTCQIYGTQIMTTPKSKTRVIIPVRDYMNINILRQSVGLGVLGDNTSAIYNEDIIKEECGNAFEFCNQ